MLACALTACTSDFPHNQRVRPGMETDSRQQPFIEIRLECTAIRQEAGTFGLLFQLLDIMAALAPPVQRP